MNNSRVPDCVQMFVQVLISVGKAVLWLVAHAVGFVFVVLALFWSHCLPPDKFPFDIYSIIRDGSILIYCLSTCAVILLEYIFLASKFSRRCLILTFSFFCFVLLGGILFYVPLIFQKTMPFGTEFFKYQMVFAVSFVVCSIASKTYYFVRTN
jgi:hypothetical protein